MITLLSGKQGIPQTAFYLTGLATSVASAVGTGQYLMHETGGDYLLSGSAAAALGLAIYASWDVLFNHRGWKRVAALAIALSCSGVSIATIYQNNWLPEQQRQQQAQQQQADKTRADQAEAKATIKQQQADIRGALGDLNRLQETDRAMIADRVAMVEKGIRPNANNAAINKARDAMNTRRQRITELQNQLSGLTGQLLAMTTPVAAEADNQPAVQDAVNIPRLARASLYDVMTLLFLLLGSWYRSQRTVKESLTAAGLEQAISQLNAAAEVAEAKRTGALQAAEQLEQRIQKAIVTCNKAIADAKTAIAPTLEPAIEPIAPAIETCNGESEQLTESDAIILLENRQIEPDEKGDLTTVIIQKATGWGRPKAESLKAQAYKHGILSRTKRGKGWAYSYATATEQQIDMGNVFSLEQVRSASS